MSTNDVFKELREENKRLEKVLSTERDLIKILENIKNCSLILRNNCICSENIEVIKRLNDFDIQYKIYKSQQNAIKIEIRANVFDTYAENHINPDISSTSSSGLIAISNVRSLNKSVAEVVESPDHSTQNTTTDVTSNNRKSDPICNECKQTFYSELDLVLHNNRNHRNVDSFVCEECNQINDSKDIHSSHLLEKHSTEVMDQSVVPVSIPPITTDQTTSETVLTETVTNESQMRLITEMIVPSSSAEHMVTRSEDNEPKRTLRKRPKKKAEKTKVKQKPKFKCILCSFEATTQHNRDIHQIKHMNDRPYKCDVNDCKQSFKLMQYLTYHKKYGHNDKQSDSSDTDSYPTQKDNTEHLTKEQNIISSNEQQIKVEFITDSDNESRISKGLVEKPKSDSDLDNNKNKDKKKKKVGKKRKKVVSKEIVNSD